METWEKFEELCATLGYDTVANAVYQYFGDWGMEECVESIATDYDIDLGEE